jgi:hypothetical protein
MADEVLEEVLRPTHVLVGTSKDGSLTGERWMSLEDFGMLFMPSHTLHHNAVGDLIRNEHLVVRKEDDKVISRGPLLLDHSNPLGPGLTGPIGPIGPTGRTRK